MVSAGFATVARRAIATTAIALPLLVGCASEDTACDPGIVEAFRALPPVAGVEVALRPSTGIGCTDTVTVADPGAFVEHYARVMREAGWSVLADGDGVLGSGPSGRVRVDRLEGRQVGVYAMSPDDL